MAIETRPRRRDAQRNCELVITAARELFAEFGTSAGMEQIASRAGVGVGTLYRQFPNKEALIDGLVQVIQAELLAAAKAELTAADGAGLEGLLRTLALSFVEHRGYAQHLVGRGEGEFGPQFRALMVELLDQAQRAGRIGSDVALSDIVATIWGVRGVIMSAGPDAAGTWGRYLDLHLVGMRAQAS